jgi:putative heme-binding domain-containing protein
MRLGGGNASAREAVIDTLTSQEKLPGDLAQLYGEFVRDGRHSGRVGELGKLAQSSSLAKRELAYCVLANIAGRRGGPRAGGRAQAAKLIESAWSKPTSAVPMLLAVARLNLTAYEPQVRRLLSDDHSLVAMAAKKAAVALKLDRTTQAPPIAKLKYENVVAQVGKSKGNVKDGEGLFTRLTCINCHTVKEGESLKGPHLGGIATRYSRAELLESVLRPSVKIAQGFETHVIALTSGKKITGFIVKESGTQIEMRDGEGTLSVIKKSDIEERDRSKVSVMPEGLLDKSTVEDLRSLVTYLESLKGK